MPLRSIISEREAELPEEEMKELLRLAAEDKSIISLGPGEPDFTPPRHIINAAKKALDRGFTHYSAVEGRKELLEAICKKLKKENGISVNTNGVVVTTGSNEGILLSMMSVLDPGEQILVPDPGYLVYIPMAETLNATALSVPLVPRNNFQITAEAIKWQLKEPKRVRAMVINSPGNPTGNVLGKKSLEEIADIAIEHDLLIISDEAYEKFVYDKAKHISIGSLNGMEDYVLTLHSFSKTYGMTGFRVGYAAGPENVIAAMRKLHLFSTISAPTMSQIAAVAALKGSQSFLKSIISDYNKRRKVLVNRLNRMGFQCDMPQGAFYAFAKFDYNMSSMQLCKWLIKNAKVAVVPGTDFGRYGEGFLRFSYATKLPLIEKALDRMEKALKKLKA